ncbi:MAG: 2-oxoglutarate dehydrogenase [Vibrionaceae bacterium]|nr:2-oxoglutarate dehydrogenase [Vibrionaceae bacterium]
MNKILLASIICVVTLAGCNSKEETLAPMQSPLEASPICSLENLAGGWSQSDMTNEARPLLDEVLTQMNATTKFKQILSVRSQIVSGINYAIEFEMDNGEIWKAIVYRSLDGEVKVMQPAQLGRFCS